jgi:hypothetical protein
VRGSIIKVKGAKVKGASHQIQARWVTRFASFSRFGGWHLFILFIRQLLQIWWLAPFHSCGTFS